jgi:hypothetical protein
VPRLMLLAAVASYWLILVLFVNAIGLPYSFMMNAKA